MAGIVGSAYLLLVVLLLIALLSPSEAISCGLEVCTGDGAFCCGSRCCFSPKNDVWDFWWFWMLWVFIFLFMLSCGFCCHRRRRNPEYVLVRGPQNVYGQPVYGAVSTTDAAPILYGQPGTMVPGHNGQDAAAPYMQVYRAAPPAYTPQTKPPDYSPVAQNEQPR